MGRPLALVLVLALLAAVGYLLMATDAAPLGAPEGTATGTEDAFEADAATVTESADPTEAANTRAEAPAAAAAAAASPSPVADAGYRVRGRCVDQASGAPLAGVEVGVQGEETEASIQGGDRWFRETTETDADGVFSLDFAPRKNFRFHLDFALDGYARLQRPYRVGSFDDPVDVGDVPMRPGIDLRGRLILDDGNGLPSIGLKFELSEPADPQQVWAGDPLRHRVTDREGRFSFAALDAGTWTVTVGSGLELRTGDRWTLDPANPPDELLLVAGSTGVQRIRGKALDEQGVPVAKAMIYGSGTTSAAMLQARTDAEGRFVLYGKASEGQSTTLHPSSAGDLEPVDERVQAAWGDDGGEVRYRRMRSSELALRVTDARTGQPVEEFGVRYFPTPFLGGYGTKDVRFDGHHPDGRVTLSEVEEGSNLLVVLPKDPRYAPGRIHFFEQDPDRPSNIELQLTPAAALQVQVVDDAGQPVPAARVELVRAQVQHPSAVRGDDGLGLMLRRLDPGGPSMSLRRMFDRSIGVSMLWRFAEGTTDDSGTVTLRSCPGDWEFALRVEKEGYSPAMLRDVRFGADGGSWTVALTQGARLRGTIEHLDALEAYASRGLELRLERVGDREGEGPRFQAEGAALGAEGAIALDGLAAGTWSLQILGNRPYGPMSWMQTVTDVAAIELRSGETTKVLFDARQLAPAFLEGSVRLGGRAPVGVQLRARRAAQGDKTARSTDLSLRDDGSYRSPPLDPGTWAIYLQVQLDAGSVVRYPATEPRTLSPGETAPLDYDIAVAPLQLTVLGSDGSPIPAGAQVLCKSERGASILGKTDATGSLRMEQVPVDRYTVKVTVDGVERQAEIEVTAGGEPLEVRLDGED